jgi:hypothetical protein
MRGIHTNRPDINAPHSTRRNPRETRVQTASHPFSLNPRWGARDVTPPQFKRALEPGLGRAIQHLRNNDPTPYPYLDAILEACFKHSVFDPQCNESLGPYLFEAIKLTGKLSMFRARFGKHYAKTERMARSRFN